MMEDQRPTTAMAGGGRLRAPMTNSLGVRRILNLARTIADPSTGSGQAWRAVTTSRQLILPRRACYDTGDVPAIGGDSRPRGHRESVIKGPRAAITLAEAMVDAWKRGRPSRADVKAIRTFIEEDLTGWGHSLTWPLLPSSV
jgi:hypothetical protein